MFKFLHAADIHLDSPLRGLQRYEGAPVDQIRSATRRALERLVDTALEHEVDFVLIAGDLYDGDWKDHNTGLFFVAQMVKLRKAGISIYIISGNHDAASKMTKSLHLPQNADSSSPMLSHTEPQTVRMEDLGVAIHGLSFAEPSVAENVVGRYPPAIKGWFNLGLLHTSLDSEASDAHARYAPCKIADLEDKEYQYWALGHIHKREIRHLEPHIVYSGNIQGRHIREAGPKGCMLVCVNDNHQVELQFLPLDVFRWEVCAIAGEDAPDGEAFLEQFRLRVTQRMEENGDLPLAVRIEVEGPCAAHQQLAENPLQWTNQLRAAALDVGAGAVWVEKLKLRTSPLKAPDPTVLQDGPVAELLQYIEEIKGDDDALSQLADEFVDLRQKLPDELSTGPDPLDLTSPNRLRELLVEVEPFLMGRLMAHQTDE